MSYVIATLFQNQIIMASDGRVISHNKQPIQEDYKKITKVGYCLVGYSGDKEYCEMLLREVSRESRILIYAEQVQQKIIEKINSLSFKGNAKIIIAGTSMISANINNNKVLIGLDSKDLSLILTKHSSSDLEYVTASSEYLDKNLAHSIEYQTFTTYPGTVKDKITEIVKRISKEDFSVNDTVFFEIL